MGIHSEPTVLFEENDTLCEGDSPPGLIAQHLPDPKIFIARN